ncbi:hypothetical protein PRZ48_008728 [Zasmidium cellare]|uniref:Amidoligase enzyme n=1 Tax=Zasmidium cellare TaxID=395010 RepID=A0ABR0EGA1_ZASCE|nr:hypothetical protein PRZ48_008728 [Zasmidium cellare]
MSDPLTLTFGIELEFTCVFRRGAFDNAEPDLVPIEDEWDGHISAGHALQYYLNAANVPATGWEEPGEVALDAFAPHSRWLVKTDAINLTRGELKTLPDHYIDESIEISSRILSFTTNDWRGEIRTVLRVLARMEKKFGARFISNHTSGFHVHIGNNGGADMPFDTVKRIFQLHTAHERNIESLHASSRILAPDFRRSGNGFLLYAPLSFFHNSRDVRKSQANNIFHWLQRIEDMHSFEDMCMFFGGEYNRVTLNGHSSAVNFDNLWTDRNERLTHTVEFRQHIGTLDYAEIVAWVTFLAAFTHFCHVTSDVDFMGLLLRATDTNFTAAHLMRFIGCPPDIVQHYDYEGEGGIIGMLPQSPRSPAQDLLDLAAANDDEVTENTDLDAVKAVIGQKLTNGYYGFDRTLGLLPIGQKLLIEMLEHAYGKVSQEMFKIDDDEWDWGGKSQTRALVLEVLGEMLREYNPALGPKQPAIAKGIQRLA